MALFLRRTIQARLDEAVSFLSKDQSEAIVRRLNLTDKATLEAQWELMWLTALNRIGTLTHEPASPNGERRVDVHFGSEGKEFVAEITSVSDIGYEEENPIDEFRQELDRIAFKHQVIGGFDLRIEHRMDGVYRDQRVRLLVPARREIVRFVAQHFEPFIQDIAKNPRKAVHSVPIEDGQIVLAYDPKRAPYSSGGGHLSFDVPYSLKRNPIYNALRAKRRQLSECGFIGLRGIILCDAGCSALVRSSGSSGITVDEIVEKFLAENSSLAFVLTVGVEYHYSNSTSRETRRYRPKVYFQRAAFGQPDSKFLHNVFNHAIAELPPTELAPYRALASLKRGWLNPRESSHGFVFTLPLQMNDPYNIKISVRRLSALLAGEIDAEEFRKGHLVHGNTGKPPVDLLKRCFEEGRMIEYSAVERCDHADDDWILLRFGRPDPAASRFKTGSSA